MVVPVEELGSLEATPPSLPPPSLPSRMSTIHRAWRMIDREYLQPHFGGRRFTEAVDSDDDEWHMHVPGAMGGKPDSKPDLFRGFTFRREASFVGPPETAKRGSKEQLTRTASRMKRQESKLK